MHLDEVVGGPLALPLEERLEKLRAGEGAVICECELQRAYEIMPEAFSRDWRREQAIRSGRPFQFDGWLIQIQPHSEIGKREARTYQAYEPRLAEAERVFVEARRRSEEALLEVVRAQGELNRFLREASARVPLAGGAPDFGGPRPELASRERELRAKVAEAERGLEQAREEEAKAQAAWTRLVRQREAELARTRT